MTSSESASEASGVSYESVTFDVDHVILCDQYVTTRNDVLSAVRGTHDVLSMSRTGLVLETVRDKATDRSKYFLKMIRRTPGVAFERDSAFHEYKVGCHVNTLDTADFMVQTIGIMDLQCSETQGNLLCKSTTSATATATTATTPVAAAAAAASSSTAASASIASSVPIGYACIILERIHGRSLLENLFDFTFDEVMHMLITLFNKFQRINMTHYDLHIGNMLVVLDGSGSGDGRLVIIDFGRSHIHGMPIGHSGMLVDCDLTFAPAGVLPGVIDPYQDFIYCITSLRRSKIPLGAGAFQKHCRLLGTEMFGAMQQPPTYNIMREYIYFAYPATPETFESLAPFISLLNQQDVLPVYNDATVPALRTSQVAARLGIMKRSLDAITDVQQRSIWYEANKQHVWRLFASQKKWHVAQHLGIINGHKTTRQEFVAWLTQVMQRHADTVVQP